MLDGVRLVERLTDPDIAGDLPFGFLKYERLYREQIDDALDLVRQADAYRIESNTIRPRKALAWNRPSEVHQGPADSIPPQLSRTRNPANHLTRGIATNQFPPPAKQMILFNGSCSRS